MSRFGGFCAMAVAIVFLSTPLFAGKICLLDNFGEYYQLKGGKLDSKTYAVKIDVPGFCVVSGHAEVTFDASAGNYILGVVSSHDMGGNCNTVRFISTGDAFLNGSGSYDQNSNGSIDGVVTFANVSCSSIPPFRPDKSKVNPNSPFVRQ